MCMHTGMHGDWCTKLSPFSTGDLPQRALPKLRLWGLMGEKGVQSRQHHLSIPGSSHCWQTELKSFSGPPKTHLPWTAELHRLAKVSLKLHLHKMKIKKSSYNLLPTEDYKITSPWQTWEMLLNVLLESALLLYRHYLLSSITRTEQKAVSGKVIWKANSKRDTTHLKISSLRRTELSCLFRRKHVWLTLSLHLIGTDEQ